MKKLFTVIIWTDTKRRLQAATYLTCEADIISGKILRNDGYIQWTGYADTLEQAAKLKTEQYNRLNKIGA